MSTIDKPPREEPVPQPAMPVKVTVYHNDDARFMPYEDGHRLTAVTSHWLQTPASDTPAAVSDWVYHAFNADLDLLEARRHQPGGETTFLAACVYRLLGYRSVSVGDVIAVDTGSRTRWLACDPFGWRLISEPASLSGEPLSAARVYAHLANQRGERVTRRGIETIRTEREDHCMDPNPPAPGERTGAGHTYTLTAYLTVDAEADLADPFARFAVFRALVQQLTAAPVEQDTPFGTATARIGPVTAVS